jgi:hypothetical protein
MFSQAGAGLPPQLMQAFGDITSQLEQRQQQINAPKKHPVLEALALTLLGGPGYAYGNYVGGNMARQRQSRQAELDALEALKVLSYSVNQTNNARNDTALAGVAAPLFQAAGVNAPQQMGADGLNLLYSLNAPAVMQLGNQQIQGGAGAGFNQGLGLTQMFEGAPKLRPYPKRETVATVTPDGGRVANQGGEKSQAPQGDGYEYVPMGEGMEGSTGIREVPTQQPLQVEAGASKQLPIPISPDVQRQIIASTQQAMTGASGQVPDYAKLPAELQALMALTGQRRSAESLNRTNASLAPALAQSLIGQRGASAQASSAQAQATMAKLPAQIQSLETSAKAKLAYAESQGNYQASNALKPLESAYNQSLKEVKAAGLVNKRGEILPKKAKTPEQQSALARYQQRAQQYDAVLQRLTGITGSSQSQAQQQKQQTKGKPQSTGDVFLDWKNSR